MEQEINCEDCGTDKQVYIVECPHTQQSETAVLAALCCNCECERTIELQ